MSIDPEVMEQTYIVRAIAELFGSVLELAKDFMVTTKGENAKYYRPFAEYKPDIQSIVYGFVHHENTEDLRNKIRRNSLATAGARGTGQSYESINIHIGGTIPVPRLLRKHID